MQEDPGVMDSIIDDMMQQQQPSPGDMTPELVKNSPRSGIPPNVQQLWQRKGAQIYEGFDKQFGKGALPPLPPPMSQMPVAPDTLARQQEGDMQRDVNEWHNMLQQAYREHMLRQQQEREAAERDVPGPFPMPDFPANYGRNLDI